MSEKHPGMPDSSAPLSLKDGAERLPLLERLTTVMHNMRIAGLAEAGAEEREAVKEVSGADTEELELPRVARTSRSGSGEPEKHPRVQAREEQDRRQRNVRDAMRDLRKR